MNIFIITALSLIMAAAIMCLCLAIRIRREISNMTDEVNYIAKLSSASHLNAVFIARGMEPALWSSYIYLNEQMIDSAENENYEEAAEIKKLLQITEHLIGEYAKNNKEYNEQFYKNIINGNTETEDERGV